MIPVLSIIHWLLVFRPNRVNSWAISSFVIRLSGKADPVPVIRAADSIGCFSLLLCGFPEPNLKLMPKVRTITPRSNSRRHKILNHRQLLSKGSRLRPVKNRFHSKGYDGYVRAWGVKMSRLKPKSEVGSPKGGVPNLKPITLDNRCGPTLPEYLHRAGNASHSPGPISSRAVWNPARGLHCGGSR